MTLKAPGTTGIISRVKVELLVGVAAGNVVLTGIVAGDQGDTLIRVQSMVLALTEGAPNTIAWTRADLTSEFTISADDQINNTGGTSSVDGFLIVQWYDRDFGEFVDPGWY